MENQAEEIDVLKLKHLSNLRKENLQRMKRWANETVKSIPAAVRPINKNLKTINRSKRVVLENEENKTETKYHRHFLSPENCGVSITDQKVAGGKESSKGKWPWMVQLSKAIGNDTRDHHHLCGGVLISETHVLIAAHCFDKLR